MPKNKITKDAVPTRPRPPLPEVPAPAPITLKEGGPTRPRPPLPGQVTTPSVVAQPEPEPTEPAEPET